jgi:xanthine dehydrogenase YagR molybdenum-binding subunit
LLKIDYETESPIFDLKANVSKSYKPSSGGSQLQLKRGDADAALQSADIKMEQTYTTPVYHHNAMEPHASVAEWNGDQLMVYDATQAVSGVKSLLASMLGLLPEKVKVVSLFIGGGFGSKGFTWPTPIVTAMAAKMVKRPVKLVLSRQQMFTTAGRRSQTIQKIALASNSAGKLTAIKHDTTSESSFVDEFVETAGLATSMLYSCPNVEISHSLVRLNKVTPCPTRAPGEAPGTYAIEAAMDELAYQLKMDPIQLRLVNYAEMDEQRQKQFSSKNLKECYQRGADAIGWSQRNPVPRSMREGNYLVG